MRTFYDRVHPPTIGSSMGAALIISLLGFVGTVACAKFLMRGEVIE